MAATPPIGVMPRRKHDEYRLNALSGAIQRYESAGKDVPPEWFAEYNELCLRLGCIPGQTWHGHIIDRIRAIEANPLATSPAQAVRFALKDAEEIIREELGGISDPES